MTDDTDSAFGISFEQWDAAFRPGMHEFAASTFTFTRESMEQVRIAFANGGPYIDAKGTRKPIYTHAVTLTPSLAVELARLLLKHYAEPSGERSQSSAEV